MERFSLANKSTQDATCFNRMLCTIKIDVKQPIKHNSLFNVHIRAKGVAEAKKVNDLYIGLIVVLYNSWGLVFIPGV